MKLKTFSLLVLAAVPGSVFTTGANHLLRRSNEKIVAGLLSTPVIGASFSVPNSGLSSQGPGILDPVGVADQA